MSTPVPPVDENRRSSRGALRPMRPHLGKPTIRVGAGAGTTTTYSIEGNDDGGIIRVTPAVDGAGSADLVVVTFAQPFERPPVMSVVAGNLFAQAQLAVIGALGWYYDQALTTPQNFRISLDTQPLTVDPYVFIYSRVG